MARYDIDRLDNRDPAVLERFARVVETTLMPWHRYRVDGLDRIPEGPALYVGNHSSGMMPIESFLFGVAVYRRRGPEFLPYGLGHEVAISFPGLHEFVVPLGAVRASHENGRRLFEKGSKVLVFPGGDKDAMRPFRRRHEIEFAGRKGYIRLALRSGVPIVPVVTAGAHTSLLILDDLQWVPPLLGTDRLLRVKSFPVCLSVPWGLTVGVAPPHLPLPTRVVAEALPPIGFDRSGEEAASDEDYVRACDARVRAEMTAAMDRLVSRRRATGLRARLRRRLR